VTPPGALALLILPFGLVFGSFLNVVIYRVPLGRSVVSPRSHCPVCGTLIVWFDNVPVLSWLLLGRRCRGCRAPIPVRYPLVELAHGLLWSASMLAWAPEATAWILLPFLSAQLALFFTDWDHQLLPDRITLPLAAAGLVLAPWSGAIFGMPGAATRWLGPLLSGEGGEAPAWLVRGGERLLGALAGAALGYLLFWSIAALWKALRGEEAMGGGDLKLMLGVGAFLGPGGVLLTIVLGSLTGSIIGLALMVRAGAGWRTRLPFGCFLTPAAVVAALWGRDLVGAYLRLAGLAP
jgi:leader peptidase (prepilin peptidase)/N-methyltransferase